MEWELIATSAVAAGIVSAASNALFAWIRYVAEARHQLRAGHREQLHEAVVEFLTAEARAYSHGIVWELACEERTAGLGSMPDDKLAELSAEISRVGDQRQAASDEMDKAAGRIRLYSEDLFQWIGPVLDHHVITDNKWEGRERTIEKFLMAARSVLGVLGWEDRGEDGILPRPSVFERVRQRLFPLRASRP